MEGQNSEPWIRDCAWCGGAPGTPTCGSRSHYGGQDPEREAEVAAEAERFRMLAAEALRPL